MSFKFQLIAGQRNGQLRAAVIWPGKKEFQRVIRSLSACSAAADAMTSSVTSFA